MFLAGSMACWHLVNYLERHVLDIPPFYKSWEPVSEHNHWNNQGKKKKEKKRADLYFIRINDGWIIWRRRKILQILKQGTRFNYGWSYVISWVGIAFILLASTFMLLSYKKIKVIIIFFWKFNSSPLLIHSLIPFRRICYL